MAKTKNPNARPGSPVSPVYLPTCSADIYKLLKNPTATLLLGVIMSNIRLCTKKCDSHHQMYAGLPIYRVTESHMAEQIGCSVPTISKCIKLLLERGLITDIRNGSQVVFNQYGFVHDHCLTPGLLCMQYYYEIQEDITAWLASHPTGYWTRKAKSRDDEAAQEEAANPGELRAAQALLQYKDKPKPKTKPKFSGVPKPQISAAATQESIQEAEAEEDYEEDLDEDYEEQEPEEAKEEFEDSYSNMNWKIEGPNDGLPF